MTNFKMLVLALSLMQSISAFAADPAANRQARNQALLEMEQTQEDHEVAYLRGNLAKFARAGIEPGPLCIQLRGGCMTQRQLGYRSSEYYSVGEFKRLPKAGLYTSIYQARFQNSASQAQFRAVAEQNGLTELLLVHSIETKEKLEAAYLSAYTKAHPNRPARTEGNYDISYQWILTADGEVVEQEVRVSNRD